MRALRCTTCGMVIHWYVRPNGDLILIGGKAYGDCRCECATWVRDARAIVQVRHTLNDVAVQAHVTITSTELR